VCLGFAALLINDYASYTWATSPTTCKADCSGRTTTQRPNATLHVTRRTLPPIHRRRKHRPCLRRGSVVFDPHDEDERRQYSPLTASLHSSPHLFNTIPAHPLQTGTNLHVVLRYPCTPTPRACTANVDTVSHHSALGKRRTTFLHFRLGDGLRCELVYYTIAVCHPRHSIAHVSHQIITTEHYTGSPRLIPSTINTPFPIYPLLPTSFDCMCRSSLLDVYPDMPANLTGGRADDRHSTCG
jgi:hypothetical protein